MASDLRNSLNVLLVVTYYNNNSQKLPNFFLWFVGKTKKSLEIKENLIKL
jgi:hypothetical protein